MKGLVWSGRPAGRAERDEKRKKEEEKEMEGGGRGEGGGMWGGLTGVVLMGSLGIVIFVKNWKTSPT